MFTSHKLSLKNATVLPVVLCLSLLLTGFSAGAKASTIPYTYKSVVIDGGGFVDGIICHPTAQNVIYARTDVGGAYRWNQATNAWEQMFNWLPSSLGNGMGIESIAIDPTNANRVYAVGGYSGNGTFFASQNQGHTWTSVPLPFAVGSNNNGRQMGERMKVDPNDSAIIYYGTIQNGLYKSTNYGQTWSQVTSFPVTTTPDGCGLPFVKFVKGSAASGSPTQEIFVGVSQTGNNLYETTNGGKSWTAVYANATLMPARAVQDNAGNMYMTYNNAPGPNGISAGAVVKLNLSTFAASTVLATPAGWEYGFGSVSVSSQNSQEVVASTIDRWYPHDGLYLSTNSGSTWTDTSTHATVNDSLSPYIGTTDPMGSWDGSAQIDPFNSNRVFFGTGGGTTIVTNLTASSATYTFNSVGIEEMVPLGLAVPSTGTLYMVFGDIGGFADTDLNTSPPTSEQFSIGGTIRGLDFAELDPNDIAILPDTVTTEGAFSANSGASWTDFATNPSSLQQYWEGNIAVSSQGDHMVWTPGDSTQYYSNDHGTTWTQSTGGASFASYYSCPAVSDRVTDGVFYAYDLASGDFLRSTNGGASFSVVSSGALPTWNSDTLYAVPAIAGDIWLPTSVGLYHSTTGGSTWTKINTGNIQCMGFGKAAPGSPYPTIFAYGTLTSSAATNGAYMSTNEGATWSEIDDAEDQWGGVGIIKGDSNIYGRVYMGSGALGVHYGDLAPNMPVNGPHPIGNLNSALVLDNQSSMISGASIVQEPYTGGANQEWITTSLGNSRIEIVNSYSGMALSVSGNSDASGATIVQSPWTDSNYQIWTLALQSNGDYLLANVGSGLLLDVVGSRTTSGTLIDQLASDGGESQQWQFALIVPPAIPVPFDFTLDGKSDILWENASTGQLLVWDMNGAAVSNYGTAFAGVVDTHWKVVAMPDINGHPDLLWYNNQTGSLVVWYMNNTTRTSTTTIVSSSNINWLPVATGDVDGKGHWSLIWQNPTTGAIQRWKMTGNALAQSSGVFATVSGASWHIVGTADFNHDGHSDLLWWNSSTGAVDIWLMNDTTVLGNAHVSSSTNTNWHLVGAPYLNGGSDCDLLWWNASTGQVMSWQMSGTSVKQNSGIFAVETPTTWQPSGMR